MTRLEASSNQELATTPFPTPAEPVPIPALLCPYHRHLSPPEQGWAFLPECSLQTAAAPALSLSGTGLCLGAFQWLEQAGCSIQTHGQWQQDSALFKPNQRAQKFKKQIQQGGKGSSAWLGLHPALLSCWTLRNQGTRFHRTLHFSLCHFTLSKFHSN